MTMPANTKIDQKLSLISKYMQRLSYTDRSIESGAKLDVDVLNGWDNPTGSIPAHLTGSRYWDYRAGQKARKLRNSDRITIITAQEKEYAEVWVTLRKGTLSHRQIVKICEKEGKLHNITATHIDKATGKERTRNIGY